MLELDVQQILSQAVSFLVLLWILKRFAWKPLLGVLDARRARIEGELQAVAKQTEDLKRLQQDLHQRLAVIDQETRAKIQEAVLEGKRIAGEIQEQARGQAQGIIAKSKDTIAMELAKAKVSLRDEVAEMTIEIVERLLKQKMDAASERKLIDSILDELGTTGSPQAT